MRYRLARAADLPVLRSLLPAGFQPEPRVQQQLVELWQEMIADGRLRVTLVEDPSLPAYEAIQMVGASVFLRDDFVASYLAHPAQGLAAGIYKDMLDGRSPVLSHNEIRTANSGTGLNLLMLHFALRIPDLADPQAQEVMFAVNTAFFFFYGGYRLKTAMQEVYGRQAADYMQAGGFRVFDDFGASRVNGTDSWPHLLLLRKEEVQPSAVNPLSFLFYPMQPRIHFSAGEQRILELALLNQSDAEIAENIGVSSDAVKKAWRRAYERASRVAPHLVGADGADTVTGARGVEKRRHLLDYLRIHLEELRPHNAPA